MCQIHWVYLSTSRDTFGFGLFGIERMGPPRWLIHLEIVRPWMLIEYGLLWLPCKLWRL